MMSIGVLLFKCDAHERSLFRRYEKVGNKIINGLRSREFNEFCLRENIVSNYIKRNNELHR